MNLVIDAGWALGLVFGIARMAGFVVSSPLYSRAFPPLARVCMTLALGLWVARDLSGPVTLSTLVNGAVANVAVGVVLGLVSGALFFMFGVAGNVLDFTSGLALAQIFDPNSGNHSAVFGRLFHMLALVIFFAVGGDRLLLEGLGRSVELVPLAGGVNLEAASLGRGFVEIVGTLLLAGIELAAPALAALFLAEVALGIAARFAPHANVFIVGISVKLLITLVVVGPMLLLFPGQVAAAGGRMAETMSALLRSLGG